MNKNYLIAEYFEAPLLSEDGTADLVLAVGHHSTEKSWTDGCTKEIFDAAGYFAPCTTVRVGSAVP